MDIGEGALKMQGMEIARNGQCKENASFSQVSKMQGTENARKHDCCSHAYL